MADPTIITARKGDVVGGKRDKDTRPEVGESETHPMRQDGTERKPMQLCRGLILMLALALPACASSEQARERHGNAAATADAEDDAKCREQGAEPDTPAYTQCRDRLMEKRAEQQAAEARRREAFQRTLGEGTSALSGH